VVEIGHGTSFGTVLVSLHNKVIPFLLDEFVEWGSETASLLFFLCLRRTESDKKNHAQKRTCGGGRV